MRLVKNITPKQKRVLEFIQKSAEENGYAPSQQEIADHFGYNSLGTVQNYLVRLEQSGYLEKPLHSKRGMQVLSSTNASIVNTSIVNTAIVNTAIVEAPATTLPLYGKVAAGIPIEAIQNNDTLDVPSSMLVGSGDHFALKVIGDSMVEEGILEDDFIIVRRQAQARNGQTVVALLEHEATVKKYFQKGGRIELRPANAKYQPIVVQDQGESSGDFKILGIVVGVIRKFH